jgi:hypothetical protein
MTPPEDSVQRFPVASVSAATDPSLTTVPDGDATAFTVKLADVDVVVVTRVLIVYVPGPFAVAAACAPANVENVPRMVLASKS